MGFVRDSTGRGKDAVGHVEGFYVTGQVEKRESR